MLWFDPGFEYTEHLVLTPKTEYLNEWHSSENNR